MSAVYFLFFQFPISTLFFPFSSRPRNPMFQSGLMGLAPRRWNAWIPFTISSFLVRNSHIFLALSDTRITRRALRLGSAREA